MTFLAEPPDGTRMEFESGTDVYAIWRDDESSRRAGWTSGDGGEVWMLYGHSVPCSWAQLIADYGEEALRHAIRLVPVAEDESKRAKWPTEVYARTGSWPEVTW